MGPRLLAVTVACCPVSRQGPKRGADQKLPRLRLSAGANHFGQAAALGRLRKGQQHHEAPIFVHSGHGNKLICSLEPRDGRLHRKERAGNTRLSRERQLDFAVTTGD
jgi:hypothetical protein